MGYSADYFEARVGSWLATGWLPRSGKVADFGFQEFHGDKAEAKRITGQFLRRQGVAEQRVDQVCSASGMLDVGNVYRALGIDYVALDVMQAANVRFFDLNCFAPPREWAAGFDLVNNEGAIEHLINPINGFQVAHEILRVGGVAVHSIPLSGHTNHGLVNPTLKFYNRLLGANNYDLLMAEISIGQSQALADERFAVLDRQGHPMARRVDLISAWLRLAYRKTAAGEFRSPFSHWADDQSGPLADRISADYAAFARFRLSERGAPAATQATRTGSFQFPTAALTGQPIRSEHMAGEGIGYEDRRKLQVHDHEHADALTRDHQRREHEHSDVLLTRLQQRDHEHSDVLQSRYVSPATTYLPLLAVLLTTVLNGSALLTGLPHGSRSASWLFALGLLCGFLPTVTAWIDVASSRSPRGRLVRRASRLLWLLSIVLFALGCIVAGPK